MMNSFTLDELKNRNKELSDLLELKKKVADNILREIENICKELLANQEMIQSKLDVKKD